MPPAMAADAQGGEQLKLDAGHWPMITAPAAVAEQLARVADGR